MIPQIQPWIDDKELIEVQKVINSTYVTENEYTKKFEETIKNYTNSKHAISITNGTLALYAALKAMDLKNEQEVIVPNMTFIATSNAVIMAGGKPVLCDINKDDFGIDLKKAKLLVNKNTWGIIPVHLYGISNNVEKIIQFAKNHGLKVLEDAAQGVGVFYKNQHTGTFGDAGILSFYGNKTITTGEGGIVLTNNDEIAKKVYRLKNHGRDSKGTFVHHHVGFNLSFTEMQAALGVSQMKKLKTIIKIKKDIFLNYKSLIKKNKNIEFFKINKDCTPVYWFSSIFIDDVEKFQEYMAKNGIQTRRFFYPLSMQPCYKKDKRVLNKGGDFSSSKYLYHHGVSLPSSYNLKKTEIEYIANIINNYVK